MTIDSIADMWESRKNRATYAQEILENEEGWWYFEGRRTDLSYFRLREDV